jgi:hypothetical protein
MRTDDLIAALAADTRTTVAQRWRFAAAVTAGLVVATLVFSMALGLRRDIALAIVSWRFDVKIALLALAAVVAVFLSRRASGPIATDGRRLIYLPALALLGAVALELFTLPLAEWKDRMIGTNARACLTIIPALSLAPLAFILAAMRAGAPASPVKAGAVAGMAAAAIGALLYGLHCFDDSPLFVAAWYPLASLPVVAGGALAGHGWLRW